MPRNTIVAVLVHLNAGMHWDPDLDSTLLNFDETRKQLPEAGCAFACANVLKQIISSQPGFSAEVSVKIFIPDSKKARKAFVAGIVTWEQHEQLDALGDIKEEFVAKYISIVKKLPGAFTGLNKTHQEHPSRLRFAGKKNAANKNTTLLCDDEYSAQLANELRDVCPPDKIRPITLLFPGMEEMKLDIHPSRSTVITESPEIISGTIGSVDDQSHTAAVATQDNRGKKLLSFGPEDRDQLLKLQLRREKTEFEVYPHMHYKNGAATVKGYTLIRIIGPDGLGLSTVAQ